MSSISELQSDIDKYDRLKERLSAVSRQLKQSTSACRDFSAKLNTNCSINGSNPVIADRDKDLGGFIESITGYIDNAIIPHIDWNNKCSRETIDQLEQEEE